MKKTSYNCLSVYMNISTSENLIWITLKAPTEQCNYHIIKADTVAFGLELPILSCCFNYFSLGNNSDMQQICFSRLHISHCLFCKKKRITFYPFECSLGPIMEILLLSYACNLPIFNKLHDIPSQKHRS